MSVANFIPTIWSARLLAHLDKAHVYAAQVNRDYEGEIKNYGDTVKINQIGDVTIKDYTKGKDIDDPEELSGDQNTLTIDQAKYFNFSIDDVDAAQVNPKLMDAAMQRSAYAMQHELILQIGERIYERKQIEKLYEEALDKLEGAILGENEGLEHVETDLVLVKELPGYPFRIEWESQNYRLIDAEGKLQKAPVSEEGEQVGLRGIFTYHDFRAEYLIYIHIYPRTLTKEEEEKEKLLRAVNEVERHSRESEALLLPAELEGKKLVWSSGGNENLLIILFFTVCGAGTAYFLKDEDLKKEVKERERQMYLGYHEVVSKLSIYLGAGMTIRTAWEKICADYEKRDANAVKNPVYEEMKITCQEMKSGISEISAYERFGKRCGIQIYGKFSTLLIQNLRKGSTKLGALFKEESQMAFEERKNAARKAGEEAGTKLLLPMMMMLCVVMLMILLPAFMTF